MFKKVLSLLKWCVFFYDLKFLMIHSFLFLKTENGSGIFNNNRGRY